MINQAEQPKNKAIRSVANTLFLIFLACIFVLDGSKYKTIFYITLPIPALLLLKEVTYYNKKILKTLFLLSSLLIYFSISTLWSKDPDLIDNLKNSLLILLFFVLSMEYCKTINYEKTINILFYFTSFTTILFITTLLYKNNLSLPTNIRLNLSLIFSLSENNPISSGAILGVIILLSLEMIKGASKQKLIIIFVTISSAFTLLLLTRSRGPLIALILTSIVFIILKRDRKTLLIMLAVFGLSIIALVATNLHDMISERLNQPNYRLEIWIETLTMMKDSWIFGQGLGGKAGITIGSGGLENFTHSHSFMLESFRTGGIVGLSIFSTFILTTVYQPIKNNKNLLFLAWLIFGMLCLLTNGRFPLMRPNIEWFCFWIPLFLWYGYSVQNPIKKRIA